MKLKTYVILTWLSLSLKQDATAVHARARSHGGSMQDPHTEELKRRVISLEKLTQALISTLEKEGILLPEELEEHRVALFNQSDD